MTIRLITGDCREVLPTLPDASVQCVVTSPPYYGLRDYQTATWEGGVGDCDHLGAPQRTRATLNANWGDGFADVKNAEARYPMRDTCGKCGARRVDAQLGLEPTPDAYIAAMVGVFREVKRVLRDDGTAWVNLGSSYASGGKRPNQSPVLARVPACDSDGIEPEDSPAPDFACSVAIDGSSAVRTLGKDAGLLSCDCGSCGICFARLTMSCLRFKAKDLMEMPHLLALALQADGWYLRSSIIWAKPNPMPESVTDRCVSAHEHIFMLTKKPRYYFDGDAIREPFRDVNVVDGVYTKKALSAEGYEARKWTDRSDGVARPPMTMRDRNYNPAGRSCRNVWTIATAPYAAAHFATFPPELAERCIRAGTSERGACSKCLAPWVRVTEETDEYAAVKAALKATKVWNRAGLEAVKGPGTGTNPATLPPKSTTTGWLPSCTCHAETRPCVVLDPFSGAGTTALVADRLGRDAVGIDLSHQYVEMTRERLTADCPLFMAFEPSPPPAEDPEDTRMADLFADAEYHEVPAAVPDVRRDAFRNSERYLNQGGHPSNGLPEAAE
jgi:DNA modification methylase